MEFFFFFFNHQFQVNTCKRDGPLEYPKTSVQAIGKSNFDNFSHVGMGLLTCFQNNRRLKWNNRPPEFEVKCLCFFLLLNQNICCGCPKKLSIRRFFKAPKTRTQPILSRSRFPTPISRTSQYLVLGVPIAFFIFIQFFSVSKQYLLLW